MSSLLFEPLMLRGLTIPNRVVVSPMCQYSANGGSASDWHLIHIGHLALSGAGLLIVEATAVERRGMITPECLGLFSDDNERALGDLIRRVRQYSSIPIGVQLSHAGRKASTRKPADGNGNVPIAEGGWEVVGPSPLPYQADWFVPGQADRTAMNDIKQSFVQATERCSRIGIDLIEIHAAHGYLLSSFLSPIANHRSDEFGGSSENRMRYPLEVISAVRATWPSDKPLGVRFNGSDWDPRGIAVEDAVAFARELKKIGCDYVDVSSGGNAVTKIPIGPGYQVPFAKRIKSDVDVTTMAVGLIRDPRHAESVLADGDADMIAIGRGFINDPRWAWHAAEDLGATVAIPPQYARGSTRSGIPSSNIIPVKSG